MVSCCESLLWSDLMIQTFILVWLSIRLNHPRLNPIVFEVQSSSESFCRKNFEEQRSIPHWAQILFQLGIKEHSNLIIASGAIVRNHGAAPIRSRCRLAPTSTSIPILASRTLESTIEPVWIFWAAFPTRLQGSGLPGSTNMVNGCNAFKPIIDIEWYG